MNNELDFWSDLRQPADDGLSLGTSDGIALEPGVVYHGPIHYTGWVLPCLTNAELSA